MKNLVTVFVFAFFIQSQQACKKEPEHIAESVSDSKLWGYWRVDSAMDISSGRVSSHLMDTLHGLPPASTKRIIIQLKEDFTVKSSGGYHFAIGGTYKMQSAANISLQLIEEADFMLRPKTDWQPMVVGAFNNASTYRVEGDGSRGSQLFLYYSSGNAVLRCSKL